MLILCLCSYRSFHVENMSHLIRYLRTDSLVLLFFFFAIHLMGGYFAEYWDYCVKLLRQVCSMASVGLEVSTTPSRICEGLQPLCPLTYTQKWSCKPVSRLPVHVSPLPSQL